MHDVKALLASSNDEALEASGVLEATFPQSIVGAVSFKKKDIS
jgi:hypothetical protein